VAGFVDDFEKLIHKDLKEETIIIFSKKVARLKESGRDAKLRKVDISGIPNESLLIKIDKWAGSKKLFSRP